MQISPAPSKPIQPAQPKQPKMQGKENSKQNQAKMQKSEPATWESLVDKLKEEVTHSMEHNIALIKEYNDQQLTQTIQRIKSQTITSNPHLNPFYPSSDLIHFYGSKVRFFTYFPCFYSILTVNRLRAASHLRKWTLFGNCKEL